MRRAKERQGRETTKAKKGEQKEPQGAKKETQKEAQRNPKNPTEPQKERGTKGDPEGDPKTRAPQRGSPRA